MCRRIYAYHGPELQFPTTMVDPYFKNNRGSCDLLSINCTPFKARTPPFEACVIRNFDLPLRWIFSLLPLTSRSISAWIRHAMSHPSQPSPVSARKSLVAAYLGLMCCFLGLFATSMGNHDSPEPWPKFLAKIFIFIGMVLNLISFFLKPERKVLRFVLMSFSVVCSVNVVLVFLSYR